MTVPVYLVRHGESEWNLRRLTQGQANAPGLTALGRRQAEDAAERLRAELHARRERVDAVVSSDLTRALETAQIIATFLDVPVSADPRLREQHLGSLEGRSYEETFAAAEQHDWSDPDLPVFGGESPRQVLARMSDFLSTRPPGGTTVAVSHGDAIRAAIAHHLGHQPHLSPWVDVPNGAIATLDAGNVTWL